MSVWLWSLAARRLKVRLYEPNLFNGMHSGRRQQSCVWGYYTCSYDSHVHFTCFSLGRLKSDRDWNQWSESDCKLKTEGGGAEEEKESGKLILQLCSLYPDSCRTLRRNRGRKKLKSNKNWRRFEGGSAPGGRGGLTLVITDGGTEETEFSGEIRECLRIWKMPCVGWLLWFICLSFLSRERSTYSSDPDLWKVDYSAKITSHHTRLFLFLITLKQKAFLDTETWL